MTNSARIALAKYTATAGDLNDKRLTAWMGLQVIAEDIEDIRLQVKHNADAHANPLMSHADTLQELENRLDLFEESTVAVMNISLQSHYLWTRIKLSELIVLHRSASSIASHSISDARTTCSYTRATNPSASPAYASALMALVQSCHGIFDSLLRSDLLKYLYFPTITTIRVLYAMKLLVALRESFSGVECPSQNLVGDGILSIEPYFNRLEKFLTDAKGPKGHKIPTMALTIVCKIRRHISREDRRSQKNISALSGLRSTADEAAQHDSDNDLEGVTTSTLVPLKQDDRANPQQQASQQPSTSEHLMGSVIHETNNGRLLHTINSGGQRDVDAVSTNYQSAYPELDFMSMTEAIPFSDSLVWDNAGEPHGYEWQGLIEDFPPSDW
ncbi:hypothetical protein MMC30_007198 [Trapelia coarctata]|nr:hypothetical protein [Trapelia coarctata]